MFKKVLLYFGPDMDGQLLAHVMDFCRRADAELIVLNVYEQPANSLLDYFKTQGQDITKLVLKTHEEQFAAALGEAGLDPEEVRSEVRWGKGLVEAVRLVREESVDLLICPTQAPGKVDSTAMHMLRKCPCPVWIHHGALWKGAVRILAPVGAADNNPANMALERKIVEHAIALAEVFRAHLHILHCWKGYLESVITSPRFSEEESAKYRDYEQRESEARFNELLKSVDLPGKAKSVMLYGDPGELIPEYVVEKHMDIVVMGSVARTGIPGLLIGNTAEKIVHAIETSAVVVKPDGFVSPIK